MSLNFNGNYIGGVPSGGGGGGVPTDNYLADGTVLTVETDGSGSFTSLYNAIEYVNGKWSNGTVTIQLGEGVFTETNASVYENYAIPHLKIIGKGTNKTTIQSQVSNDKILKLYSKTTVSDIKFQASNTQVTSGGIAFFSPTSFATGNLIFDSFDQAIQATYGSVCKFEDEITINNSANAIVSTGGSQFINKYGVKINFNNITQNAFFVQSGGKINMFVPVITWNNVTTKVNQTVGTATNNGWITGITV